MTLLEVARERGLLASLEHELRNPLAAAVASVAAAAAMTDENDPRAGHLRRARADLERVAGLLGGLVELAASGRVRPEPVDVPAMVRDLAGRQSGLRVRARTGRRSIVVRVDAALFERVLQNLLDNARRAGARAVDVEVFEEGAEWLTIRVADDGPGIPVELGERVFEPFVSGGGGSGLGLCVALAIVEAHGGRLELEASPSGAAFRIRLPR